jgi:hemolysin III
MLEVPKQRWERAHTRGEERLNVITHGVGVLVAVVCAVVLLVFSIRGGDIWAVVSTAVFGASMILLYVASTLCHMTTGKRGEKFYEFLDNISIYFLIAGTYTPYTLTVMRGWLGWLVFGCIWGLAALGVVLSARFKNRQPRAMVFMYLGMGWFVFLVIYQVWNALSPLSFLFLVLGGLSYMVGVIFYVWRRLKFSHAIWHTFVLSGTIMFFFSVLYGCVLV